MAIIQYGGIRIDVQANTQGVKALRTDMASLSREFAKTMTPVEKLESKLGKIAAQIKKHGEATVFTDRATIGAVNTYLEAEKAAGRYAEAIDFVAKRLPELAASMKQLEETRRRDDAMAAAAASAKRQAEVDKLVLQERIERERQAAALSKKIDKDTEAAKVAAAKAASDQQKQLMQQLSDVEDFFEQRSLARKKSYIDHKVRMEKEAAELLKSITKQADEFEKQQREQAQAQLDLDAKLDAERIHRKRNDRKKAAEITAEDEKRKNDEAAKIAKQTADLNEKLLQEEIQRRRAARQSSARLDEQDAQDKARIERQRRRDAQAAAQERKREVEKEALAQQKAQRMVNAVLREGMSHADQLREKLARLHREMEKGRITKEQYAAASKVVDAQIRSLSAGVPSQDRLAQFGTSFAAGLSPIGALTAGAVGFTAGQKIIEFGRDSVSAYMDMRSALIKLEVTLGSASKAKVMFEQLRSIAAQMSLTSEAVLSGAVTMAQFGVSSEQLEPAMRRLAIISSGNSERLRSLAIAYGQVAAAGRLTGQETLQFVNAGFNPLAEIARTTGKSMAQLRKEMENGQITVKMVAEAFRTATEAGGRFFGMAEKLSGELSGKLNKVKSEITKIKEELAGLAIDVVQGPETAEKANENLQQFRKGINVMRTDLRAFMQGGPSALGQLFSQSEDKRQLEEIQKNLVTGKTFAEREVEKALDRLKLLSEAEAFFKAKAESIPLLADEVMKSAKQGFKSFFDEAKNISRNIIVPIAQGIDEKIKKRADEIRKAFEKLAESIEEGRRKRAESILDSIMTPAEQQAKQVAELADLVRFKFLGLDEAAKFLAKQQSSQDRFSTELPKAFQTGTKEAYDLMRQVTRNIETKQLEEQRRQRVEQEKTNELLKKINEKEAIGVIN